MRFTIHSRFYGWSIYYNNSFVIGNKDICRILNIDFAEFECKIKEYDGSIFFDVAYFKNLYDIEKFVNEYLDTYMLVYKLGE